MILVRTYDRKMIDEVLKHPKVKPSIGDDYTKTLDIEYPINNQFIYLLALSSGEPAGLFVCIEVNTVALDCHSAVLPQFYGGDAKEMGLMAIDWVFENTEYQKLTGLTPVSNKLALKYNQDIGFEREGLNKKSIMRNGRLEDQVYFGLERKEWALKQQ